MSAVDDTEGRILLPQTRPYREVARGYTYFEEGDVLFAKITPCMQNGKAAIALGLTDGVGFGSTEFHVLRAGPWTCAEWLFYFIRRPVFRREAARHFTGAVGQQRVPEEFLSRSVIPLPPPTEQRRIAACLSEQMAEVDRMREAAQVQVQAVHQLSGALLRRVFESQRSQSWASKRIGEFAETCSGTTPSRERRDYYMGEIPWVKTGELTDGIIEDTGEHVSQEALRETSLKLLPPGTLLVAMYGQGQTRGRTGILARSATTNQACFAILPNPREFDPFYLQLWFRYSYPRLRRESDGRGGNQPNLSGDVVRCQKVPLPSVAEQEQVIRRLSGQIAIAQSAHQAAQAQLDAINALPGALLEEVFGGFEPPPGVGL